MTATAINYSNMMSQSWQNIYEVINTKTNVADPTTSSAEFRKWVYSRFPDVKANDFTGYPFIVVQPANLEIADNSERQGNSLDDKSKMVSWSIDIDVYTSDRQYKQGKSGNGYIYLSAICDDLVQSFNNITIRNDLRANGLFFVKLIASGNDVSDLNNERVYVQSFTLTFKNKIGVTA